MEKISENVTDTTEVKRIEVPVEFLQSVRNLIEVTNERIKWKTEELLPVGILIKNLDELIKSSS